MIFELLSYDLFKESLSILSTVSDGVLARNKVTIFDFWDEPGFDFLGG